MGVQMLPQQSHKYFQETAPALVKVTQPGCPSNICLHLFARLQTSLQVSENHYFFKVLPAESFCFEIPLYPSQWIQRFVPRLVPPCLRFSPLKNPYPESSGPLPPPAALVCWITVWASLYSINLIVFALDTCSVVVSFGGSCDAGTTLSTSMGFLLPSRTSHPLCSCHILTCVCVCAHVYVYTSKSVICIWQKYVLVIFPSS